MYVNQISQVIYEHTNLSTAQRDHNANIKGMSATVHRVWDLTETNLKLPKVSTQPMFWNLKHLTHTVADLILNSKTLPTFLSGVFCISDYPV